MEVRDNTNLEVFSQTVAKDVLIVCHEEGKVLGWRTWNSGTGSIKPTLVPGVCNKGTMCRSLLRQLARTCADVGNLKSSGSP